MKLTKDLVILDLETTGAWVEKDKIIEIAMIRRLPNGEESIYVKKVNPKMPIPKAVSLLTGITNEDVKAAPAFNDIALEVLNFIGQSDIAGFNIQKFDLPILERELNEAGHKFEWQHLNIYDAQVIYHVSEKRDLSSAYQFYCNRNLDDAHSALADTRATLEILEAQVARYIGNGQPIESLGKFEYKQVAEFYDKERKFRWWNGKLYMMFGKYAKKYSLEEIVKKDHGYLEWILNADFSQEVKSLIRDVLDGRFPVFNTKQQIELFENLE